MANPFVHNELNTTDTGKAKKFYGSLFDWKLEDMPMGDMGTYTTIAVGKDSGGVGGGIMQHPMPGQPSFWLSYVSVDDVKASTAKAKSLGANIIKDVTPIPEVGTFSIISDPTGAVLGLFQAAKKA